jgi:PAS domain S-box-containing protein
MTIERASTGIEVGSERIERFANLLALSYEPMLAWQLDGPIEFWNTGAERLYGFAAREAVGRNSHALLQTKFPVEFSGLLLQLRNEHYWSGELRHICKDGREVVVDSRMQLVGDDTVLEVNRDVTQHKQIEAAIRESELGMRFLASIVESSDDAIVSKNLDGIITSWNKGAERIFGYTAEEAIGQPITIVIPIDRQSEEREILTRIRRGERIEHFETIRQRKHGSLITVSLTVSSGQKCRRQDCWSVEDCEGYYRAEAEPSANRHSRPRSRTSKQEFAGDRAGSRPSFAVRYAARSEGSN